jgi:RhoGEF domain
MYTLLLKIHANMHCKTPLQQSASFFKMYSTYINNYDVAMKRVRLLEAHTEFRAFIRACELQEGCRGLDLRSYLIQPVQRVPRYKLLLAELLKHTRDTHPDWSNLTTALTEVRLIVCAYCNV